MGAFKGASDPNGSAGLRVGSTTQVIIPDAVFKQGPVIISDFGVDAAGTYTDFRLSVVSNSQIFHSSNYVPQPALHVSPSRRYPNADTLTPKASQ